MIRFIIALIIFMLWAVWARNYYVCEILGECEPPQTDVDSTYLQNIPNTLTLKAGDYVILEDYPQFYFDYCSHAYTYIDGNEKFLTQVASFLKENPEAKLVITGHYLEKEKETADKSHYYNDLGLARAYTIVDKLIEEYKISRYRIRAFSKVDYDEPIDEPLSFNIKGYTPPVANYNEADTAFLKQVQNSIKDITFNDKSARFAYNSKEFEPRASFEIYVDSLRNYFELNPNDYLLIIGHTDSKGTKAYNRRLGRKRAESVKAYLRAKGVEAKIRTQSKGENSPLVPDQNEDGSYDTEAMEQNRRVNILIKNID